jgi:hypothetical protein
MEDISFIFFTGVGLMNIIDKTDDEILEIANPMWADLVKYSNEGNYGAFTRNFSSTFIAGANEVEMGKQFARSELAKNLSPDYEYLGIIRRGEHVTVLYKQKSTKKPGEWLGRLVLGYEKDKVRIFGATIF